MSLIRALQSQSESDGVAFPDGSTTSQEHLANPWGLIHRSSFAPQRSGSKRRRRAPLSDQINMSENDISASTDVSRHMFATRSAPDRASIEQIAKQDKSTEEDDDSPDQITSQQPARRRMRPAVSWMSVKHERKALNEIRNMDDPLGKAKQKLQSIPLDITVEEFALHYVIGHHSKRQQSITSKKQKASIGSQT
jgi:hypothetical protein